MAPPIRVWSKVLDGDESPEPYLVMELLHGESVEDQAARNGGHLPLPHVLNVVDQLLAVLEAAHAAGIVHRDLKPANLFWTKEGRLKVLDFGIARLRQGTDGTKTKTGTYLGTPVFMAPEQAAGLWSQVDARTDLWAVGAITFTLLTGRYVHDGANVNQLLVAAATRSAPSLAAFRVAPTTVVALVDHSLAFRAQDRFPDAKTMRAALQAAAAELEAPELVRPPQTIPWSPPGGAPPGPDVAPPPPPVIQEAPNGTVPVPPPGGLEPAGEREPGPQPGPGRPPRRKGVLSRPAPPWAVPGAVALAFIVSLVGGWGVARWNDEDGESPSPSGPTATSTISVSSLRTEQPPLSCLHGQELLDGGCVEPCPRGMAAIAPEKTVGPFCMDRYEVSAGAYRDCETNGHCTRPAAPPANAYSTYADPKLSDHPMIWITQQEARNYCQQITKGDLPTRAQWVLAAGGPSESRREYPWTWGKGVWVGPSPERVNGCGSECDPKEHLYRDDDGFPDTAPVTEKLKGGTPEGILNLAGNVWEWVREPGQTMGGGMYNTAPRDFGPDSSFIPTVLRSETVGFRCVKERHVEMPE